MTEKGGTPMTAPKTVTTDWMWDHDATGEDVRVRIPVVNHGTLDRMEPEECGCIVAVYTLEECGGPADLIVKQCDRFGQWDCSGHGFTVGPFTVKV